LSEDSLGLLRALARLYGVQTAYYGIGRRRKEASPEALVATLRELGASLETFREVEEALRERHQAIWRRPVEPVLVAWDGGPLETTLRFPTNRIGQRVLCRIQLEDGTSRSWSRRVGRLPTLDANDVEGVPYESKRLVLAGKLPPGYHRLTLEGSKWSAEATILSAPIRAYSAPTEEKKLWGIFVPLYALHTERSWGAGDFTDLEALLEWTSGKGGGLVSTLPFLAAFLDEPFEPSPYSPASRLFWNELYVDPTRAPEWEACRKARQHFASSGFRRDLEALRSSSRVDYRRQMARKREVLEMLAESLHRGSSTRRAELERFVASRPALLDYARFRATMERRRAPWPQWPLRQRGGDLHPRDYQERSVRYHLYSQWLAHEQIRSLSEKARQVGPGLYLDMPLGTHPFGYDIWREQEIFAGNVTVGAPPDPIFTGGQDWGFPPLHPERSRERGHRYVAAALRHQLEHAGLLRIDHVMGLHRLFWIPQGIDSSEGVYVRYPAEELYALLSLESHRHRSTIVGENLGIVPAYVNQAMSQHNIRGIYLMQYSLKPDPRRPFKPVPVGSVAGLNTHDTPTFAAYWKGLDIEDRLDLALLDPQGARKERKVRQARRKALLQYLRKKTTRLRQTYLSDLLRACLSRLRASRASVLVVNLEDMWLETEPQNVPGSGKARPNWHRRIRYRLEEISVRFLFLFLFVLLPQLR